MRTLREFLRNPRFPIGLPGPCAACGARGSSPLCEACLAASSISSCPAVGALGPHPLHFLGAYHAYGQEDRRALSPLGLCLRAFKDHGDRYAGRCLAALFAERGAAVAAACHAVVPVPPDPGRLRERGLSPAAWLARALSKRCGARMCTSALRRVAGRRPQRGLGGDARRNNARGAFVLGRCNVEGYSIVLADDVITTGATLLDAARCLGEAGAAEVVCVVLACADDEVIRRCRSRTGSAGTNGTARRPG